MKAHAQTIPVLGNRIYSIKYLPHTIANTITAILLINTPRSTVLSFILNLYPPQSKTDSFRTDKTKSVLFNRKETACISIP